jgi:putative ABC transport system permease protein
MLGNYALSLYRTLSRHRLYAALNTLGLALGIAVCVTLFLVTRFETSFDRWIPGADSVVRVNQIATFPGRPSSEGPPTQAILLPALITDFPEIEAGARVLDNRYVVRNGERQAYERVALADPNVFQVLPRAFVAGDPKTALSDTTSLVIDQSMARKYFGAEQVLGRRLSILIEGQVRDYKITGVMRDLPANTHLDMQAVGRFDVSLFPQSQENFTRWGANMLFTYLRLRSPADVDAVQARLKDFVNRRVAEGPPGDKPSEWINYRLVPLVKIHFHDAQTTDAFKPGADRLFVYALGSMGLVTLLIAIVNYVSLATARSGMRAREVAVRKVMGATRRALLVQFIGESVALALAAGLIAAALVELTLPGISAVLGQPITMTYFGAGGIALPLIGLCLAVGLLSGVYPAMVLSGFRPAAVLASARTPGSGRTGARLREVLAVGQFAIAICLMICTAVIFSQTQYVRNADLGFRREGLLIVKGVGDMPVAPHMQALLEGFRRTEGVISATASDRRPAGDSEWNSNAKLVSNPSIEPILTLENIAPDYAKTYGLKLVAGRLLDEKYGLDDRAGLPMDEVVGRGWNAMINVSAARALGFTDPHRAIGQQLRFGRDGKPPLINTIVGVVQDVRFRSPRNPTPPQVYTMNSGFGPLNRLSPWSMAVRVRDGDQQAVLKRLEMVWRGIAPDTPFQAETVQAAFRPYYDPDARRAQLFAAGAVLAAMIACLGLYGLASFNTSRRTKEIGIRKTLGASTSDVMRLLIGEFLRPVLVANLLAWPLAWFAMTSWLAGFDQRITLNPAYFLIPTAAAVLVAVATVAEQAFRVARAEPSRALRYE